MIVTGGFNVFPREVEDVVAEHPSVAQVCVIGTPDEKWGEAVTAVVVLRPDAPADEASVSKMTAEIKPRAKGARAPGRLPTRGTASARVPGRPPASPTTNLSPPT